MSVLELTVVVLYLLLLAMSILMIQMLDLGRRLREQQESIKVVETEEEFVDTAFEEDDSEEEKAPFDPSKEDYTMTENPILRHRTVESETPWVKQVD